MHKMYYRSLGPTELKLQAYPHCGDCDCVCQNYSAQQSACKIFYSLDGCVIQPRKCTILTNFCNLKILGLQHRQPRIQDWQKQPGFGILGLQTQVLTV